MGGCRKCAQKRKKEKKMAREGKSERIQTRSAAAAGVQLVRLHRDKQTKAIRSPVGMSAPVCVSDVFLGQVCPSVI